jgi:UDP-N-acetylglucosamine/UDP-N-acetylgalactosamine 4-epimerase
MSFDFDGCFSESHRWLVTGAAGFIGSHLVEQLLKRNQSVVGFDNLSTGFQRNLDNVKSLVSPAQWDRFRFLRGDLRVADDCAAACEQVDFVLHQAALGSVPRSIAEPIASHQSNVDGFINMLQAARQASVKRFVYASSSSVYGDEPTLPKVESRTGRVLSPYAATKHINEVYASVFERVYGVQTIGLRYFNVFGKRQDPNGAYAAVIPRWVAALKAGQSPQINGDGSTSRDFCFVLNAVQANLRAALAPGQVTDAVYNVAVGHKTSLLELFGAIRARLAQIQPDIAHIEPTFAPFRNGDIKDSLADTARITKALGYAPTHTLAQGLDSMLND